MRNLFHRSPAEGHLSTFLPICGTVNKTIDISVLNIFLFLWDKCPTVKLLSCTVSECLVFKETACDIVTFNNKSIIGLCPHFLAQGSENSWLSEVVRVFCRLMWQVWGWLLENPSCNKKAETSGSSPNPLETRGAGDFDNHQSSMIKSIMPMKWSLHKNSIG